MVHSEMNSLVLISDFRANICNDTGSEGWARNTYVPYLFHGILIKLQLKFRLIFQFHFTTLVHSCHVRRLEILHLFVMFI